MDDALAAAPGAANVVYSAHRDRALRRYNGTIFCLGSAELSILARANWFYVVYQHHVRKRRT